MPLLHVLVLALVQGLTEFLPVSSSGHLILTWSAFGAAGYETAQQTRAEQLTLDVAVHVGTLFAVCLYYFRDLKDMARGMLRAAKGQNDPGARLALYVIAGTIPVGLAGIFFKDFITGSLQQVTVVAWATIGFGILLYAADKMGMTLRRLDHMTWTPAIVIGLFQVLALIPGTSRSGITMTAARFFGFERTEAARFSLLLSIPTIAASGLLIGLDLYESGNVALGLEALAAVVLAFVVALFSIALMMGWLRRQTFTPFVIYRLILGGALLWWVYA